MTNLVARASRAQLAAVYREPLLGDVMPLWLLASA